MTMRNNFQPKNDALKLRVNLVYDTFIHSFIFFSLNTIKGVSNPWIGQVEDKTVIGTSGQPIQDIQKVCGIGTYEAIDCLEKTLEWRHMCPTAPDTIPCLPFHKKDPFILKECPSIYFAGNMEKFDTKLYIGMITKI